MLPPVLSHVDAGATVIPGPDPLSDATATLYQYAFRLMKVGLLLRSDVADRAARRLVRLVTADPGLMVTVYFELIPKIQGAEREPWIAVDAAMSLGLILEQLRRAPAVERDTKVRAGQRKSADSRRTRDTWLAEVEARPPGKLAADVYQEIADRGPRLDPESVKRAVSRARKDRRTRK